VHATQRLAVASQSGVAPEHVASSTHSTHHPAFGPLVAHTPERHTLAVSAVHGPPPSG
jgi:hypothetical protein